MCVYNVILSVEESKLISFANVNNQPIIRKAGKDRFVVGYFSNLLEMNYNYPVIFS